jgi:hypothetical protein
MKRIALSVACIGLTAALCDFSAAQVPADKRPALVEFALKNFWGNAVDSKGQPIEPTSATDRATVPVDDTWVTLAIDTGEASGALTWCGLNWQVTMRALTARARSEGMSDKQVAFVTVLHGLTQGTVIEQRKTRQCSEADKADVQQRGVLMLERLAGRAA